MKLKVAQLYNAVKPMSDLFKQEITIGGSFRLHKIVTMVDAEIAIAEKTRQEIHQRYGILEGDRWIFTQENATLANEELNDLFNQDVELEFKPISISSMGKAQITTEQMGLIAWAFDDA